MVDAGVTVWFNPQCSKCRGADTLLAAHGVPTHKIHYLDDPPSREERHGGRPLGAEDPRAMIRTQEPLYGELGLDTASDEALIDALAAHPELIERPIVIRADHAVVARPPELLLSLLDPAVARSDGAGRRRRRHPPQRTQRVGLRPGVSQRLGEQLGGLGSGDAQTAVETKKGTPLIPYARACARSARTSSG